MQEADHFAQQPATQANTSTPYSNNLVLPILAKNIEKRVDVTIILVSDKVVHHIGLV